ncbi:MAG TPA: phosphoesterase [Planctomycetaceae bacterium]|nr:phosphoesterase [Planctomycetaceae bacterium]
MLTGYAILIAVVLGHFSLHLAIYNRINALGWHRKTIKKLVKVFFASCLAIPTIFVTTHWPIVTQILDGSLHRQAFDSIETVWYVYGVLCLIAVVALGIPFLLWRPIFALEATPVNRRTTINDVAAIVSKPLPVTARCRWASRIPMNQIFKLAIEEIELPVAGLPLSLDGYKIAHLSDLHFTGHISPQMVAYVVEQANDWSPNLFALTGDIIDEARCIDWLEESLGHASATDGSYFVLGNHDTRVADPNQVRHAMTSLGWRDIGGQCINAPLRATGANSVSCQILGNERPWFGAPETTRVEKSDATFRLLLSHSPDQIWWARRHRVHLMLAGHTHGGQGRLPLIGPLLSPSFHGSRFASGHFYKPPTTMHVSRGLSGTHLLRINCRPELSLLTLRVRDSLSEKGSDPFRRG